MIPLQTLFYHVYIAHRSQSEDTHVPINSEVRLKELRVLVAV